MSDRTVPRALVPLLGARRDGGERVESARGWLVTLLGEFVLPNGRSAWTQTLVAALDALGVSEPAARQALSRSEDLGWLRRTRHGRRTRWELSDDMAGLLTAGADRIYGFGRADRPWDGSWLVVLTSVPDADRGARYRLTTELGWAGFGSLGQGVWISPWVEREPDVVGLVDELGVDARSFRAELGRLGSPTGIANQAWDLAGLQQRYASFLDDVTAPAAEDAVGADLIASLAWVVHRWRRFPSLDPELPLDLLPDGWPRRRAAERFAEIRADLVGPATDCWLAWEADAEA